MKPTKLAYKAIHGPYNWNQFLLAPPGCKAVIYKSPDSHGSWGSRGTNAWYVGPSLDHYCCNHYFVPNMQAYCISGSAESFPQHCQVPFLMWNEHLQEVSDKLVTMLRELEPSKRKGVLTLINNKLSTAAPPTAPHTLTNRAHKWLLPASNPQCVPRLMPPEQRGILPVEQRVDTSNPNKNPTIVRITDAPPIITAPNPTTKGALKVAPHTHRRCMQNNRPGSFPLISHVRNGVVITTTPEATLASHCSPGMTTAMRTALKLTKCIPRVHFVPIPSGLQSHNIISQEAINFLTKCV
jgi:hypothetical protein